MIVVDASVVVDALIGPSPSARRLVDRSLAAPHLLDAEVGRALRGQVRRGEIEAVQAERALARLQVLGVERYGHAPLLGRAWGLRANLTFYDALYVALAELLGAPLVTGDQRLAGAPGIRTVVEVVPRR